MSSTPADKKAERIERDFTDLLGRDQDDRPDPPRTGP